MESSDKTILSIDQPKKKLKIRSYRGFFVDIEISKKQYTFLDILLNTVLNIFIISIALIIEQGFTVDLAVVSGGDNLISGMGLGILFVAIFSDKIKKRVNFVKYLVIISTIILFLQVTFLRGSSNFLHDLCFFVNGFISVVLFILFLILYLEYSSVLERGRVFSFLLIGNIMYALFAIFVVYFGLFIPLLIYIPFVTNIYVIYRIFKEKQLERPLFKEKIESPKHVNKDDVICMLIITVFSFTIALATPTSEVIEFTVQPWIAENFILAIVLIIIFSIIIVIVIGFIFDFTGRVATFTSLIVLLTMSSFLNLFDFNIAYFNVATILSSYVGVFIAIPLLIGDIAKRKNYGKVLTLTFILFAVGWVFGYITVGLIPQLIGDAQKAQAVISGIQYMSAIACLVILLIGEEALPLKEQQWFDSLIHLYAIQESGVLMFDHEFIKEQDRTAQSDLISGGIIGLITMLDEITKGKEKLRIIDHGDKKLMFKFTSSRNMVFSLLVKEDLIVLRYKLDEFVKDFEENYHPNLSKLPQGQVTGWQILSELVEKYFKRKYFELFFVDKKDS